MSHHMADEGFLVHSCSNTSILCTGLCTVLCTGIKYSIKCDIMGRVKPYRKQHIFQWLVFLMRKKWGEKLGGEGGIRTPGTRKRSTVFKTAALNHSATSP